MKRSIFAAVAAALAGLAFWRRKTLKEDAERAKKAATTAAGEVTAKVRGDDAGGTEDDAESGDGPLEGDADASTDEDAVEDSAAG